MRSVLPLLLVLLPLAGCKSPEESHSKAFIGAVMVDGAGGPPVSDSVVVVAGGLIRAAGSRSNVPIPAEADKIDGSGKVVIPALVDIAPRDQPESTLRASTPGEAHTRVAEIAARKPKLLHIPKAPPAVVEAALEAARTAGIPAAGHISTLAEARLMVDNGANCLVGMIRDTEDLDHAFVVRLRSLRIVVAPSLLHAGDSLEVAKRNTRRLFQAGVPIGLASLGGDPLREAELLADAGIPPLDVIVAATRNGALALRDTGGRGAIQVGGPADLLLLSAHPGEDIRNLRKVALRMSAGEWVRQ